MLGNLQYLTGCWVFERSIVSGVPGTTRDFITSGFLSGGFRFDLIDTAGLRITKDDIESSGISFAKEKRL